MCGRYTLTKEERRLRALLGIDKPLAFLSRYNIAPSQEARVIANDSGHAIETLMRWGLIPSWADDASIGNKLINARGETIAEKPSFRTSFSRRRCLVPADGFYEWQKAGKGKTPVWIHRKDREPFVFAGLWDRWQPPKGEKLCSFTIITTSANEKLRPVHDRMPVILSDDDAVKWLNPRSDTRELQELLRPYPEDELEFFEVSKLVNSPQHDGPDCIEPASWW